MSEKQFVKGFSIKSIQTKYGELLKGAINLEQIGENPKNEKGWVNFTIKRGKETGSPYAEIDNYKKED